MLKHFIAARNIKGQVFPELIGTDDHCTFDLTNEYCVFCSVIDSPTKKELRSFFHEPKDFRLSIFDDVMYFTLKVGSLGWNEAPFSPHLSKQANVVDTIDAYTKEVEILLVDSKDGVAKYCKSFTLDKVMSSAIKISIEDALQKKFEHSTHFEHIQQIQLLMTSEQIAQSASARQILE